MSLDFTDIFGGNARLKLTDLEARFSDLEDRHELALAELGEVTSHLEAVMVSEQSREQYEALSREYVRKSADLQQSIRQMEDDSSRSRSEHEKASSSLKGQIRDTTERKASLVRDVTVVATNLKGLTGEVTAAQKIRTDLDRENRSLTVTRDSAKKEISLFQNQSHELKVSVSQLSTLRKELSEGAEYLEQIATRSANSSSAILLEHDLRIFLEDDRATGAYQVNLDARPLLLVVELAKYELSLALVRVGGVTGSNEILVSVEARSVIQEVGVTGFEKLLAEWLVKQFVARNNKQVMLMRGKSAFQRFLPMARRLLTMLSLGAPLGVVEEIITIDSERLALSAPLTREELVPLFGPLLDMNGNIPVAVRRFLSDNKRAIADLDRIVCFGIYRHMPLLADVLATVFQRPVLHVASLPSLAVEEPKRSAQTSLVLIKASSKTNLIATNLRLKTVHPSTGSGRTVFSSATGRFSVHGELVEP